MYQFRYDFWDEKRFPGFSSSMRDLYVNSLAYYYRYTMEEAHEDEDLHAIDKLFAYVEYYLAALVKLGYAKKSNYDNILNRINGIKLIKLLNPELRDNLNGLTYNRIITMNPTPGKYDGLDTIESLQIAMFHELGHIITSSNNKDLEYLQQCLKEKYPELIEGNEEYLTDGFKLLDEVAVENTAETIFYDRQDKKRDKVQTYRSPILYPEGTFDSNLLEYREFQELAYRFALCLDFIPKDDDMNKVIDSLTRVMFSKEYVSKLYLELTRDKEKGEDLIAMLMCMGKIKKAKYQSFGLGDNENEQLNASCYYKLFDSISNNYIEEIKKEKVQS